MKLARYWTRGRAEAVDSEGQTIRVVARGWSDESVDAARARAGDIARRVAQRLISHPGERNQYQYGDRPLPEPVIRQLNQDAVVTRNAYGALVLNTNHLMFVDIDREDSTPSSGGGLEEVMSGIFSLFGKSAPAKPSRAANTVAEAIQQVAARHNLSGRIYKTAGGHRVLITSAPFRAGTSETEALLNEFGSDRMYMHLCRVQESFRARLTPKPWRCGFSKPPVEFPFETPQDEAQYRRWEAEYNSKSSGCATCRFVATFGSGKIASEFEDLVQYHDTETKASSNLPLA